MNKFRKPHGNGGRNGGQFGGRGPSRPSFEKPAYPRFGGPRDGSSQMFDAVCSKCGNACQVPFRPNGQKPVYCKVCFGGHSQAPSGREGFIRRDVSERSFEPRTDDRGIVGLKQQVGAMNTKIDSMLRILEAMSRTAAPTESAMSSVSQRADLREVFQKDFSKKKITKRKGAIKK